MRLKGERALVTGASRGIGRAIAIAFAREGADVAITARSANDLTEVRRAIEATGRRAVDIVADLADRGAPASIMEQTTGALGGIDILVNNAGIGSSSNPKPIVDYDDDFWDKLIYINLTVPYLLSKYALHGMLDRKHGRIVNIASIASKRQSIHGVAYSASKSGLLGLTRTLAMEVATDGITCNAICPGPTRSIMNDRRVAYDAQRLGRTIEEHERTLTPIGRRLEPEEVASLAVYLASSESAGVTGQAWNVDGGLLLYQVWSPESGGISVNTEIVISDLGSLIRIPDSMALVTGTGDWHRYLQTTDSRL